MLLRLETERLVLLPYSQGIALAALTDKTLLQQWLSVRVPEDWPWTEMLESMPFFALLATDPTQLGWGAWLIVQRREATVIGDIGFSGKPTGQGAVTMGFNILPSYRHQGYGFESVKTLMEWAKSYDALHKIIAHCHSDNESAIRILRKLGMRIVSGSDGLMKWQWQKPLI